jgi:hypothetical protein
VLTDDQYLELKLGKIRPKKIRVSYAAVLEQKLPSKQHLDSNHRAYKAWEDRKGRSKREDTRDSITSHDTKLQEKMEGFTAKVHQRKMPNIPLSNRVSILSNIIM